MKKLMMIIGSICAMVLQLWAELPYGTYWVDDLLYSYSGNGDEVSVSYCDRNITSVNIPSKVTLEYQEIDRYDDDTGEPIYVTKSKICNVTRIEGWTFSGCGELTRVTIPSSVCSIEGGTFHNCSKLTHVSIPSSVRSIGDYAFYGCSALSIETIPSAVTSIGDYAFYGCDALINIEIHNGLKSIGRSAFRECNKLRTVQFHGGIEEIGQQCFEYCDNLTSVTLPTDITRIGDYMFNHCGKLETINLPDAIVSIGVAAFQDCENVKIKKLPNSLNVIGDFAFSCCYNMSAKIPNGVTDIGAYAFQCCVSLDENLSIPSMVAHIGKGVFANCTQVNDITIPSSVTSIDEGAFYGDSASIHFEGKPPSVLMNDMECNNLVGTGFCVGYFKLEHTDAWMAEIENDYWYGIEMHCEDEQPTTSKFTIKFDVNDSWFHNGSTTSLLDEDVYPATGTMSEQSYVEGQDVSLSANRYTRDGFEFGGWATAPNFDAVYQDGDTIKAANLPTSADGLTLYAVWNAKKVTMTFNYLNWAGASENVKTKSYTVGYTPGWPYGQTSDADVIEGWYTAPIGGTRVDNVTWWIPTKDTTYYLLWHHKKCTIKYKANGGTGVMSDQAFTMGINQRLSVNQFTWDGYVFSGWAKSSDGKVVYKDGEGVLLPTVIDGGIVTLYAVWEVENMIIGGDSSKPDVMQSAQEYDGCVYDGEKMVGTIVVKAAKGKADRKSGKVTSKLTITIQVAGEKVSLKGDMDVNAGSVEIGTLSLKLGANGMSGTYGAYSIDGARNVFAAKDATSKTTAASVLAKWQGAMAIAYPEVSGGKTNAWVGLSVTIAAKGKAKIAGTLADGSKVSVSGQMVVGSEWSCVPVNYAKKNVNLAFVLWLKNDGSECEVSGIEGAMVGKANGLDGECKFQAADLATLVGDDTYAAYFPNGVSVRQDGTKWVVANGAKAGKVALGKDGNVDESKAGANAAALKLTYTAKTGAFKGSFKAYKQERGKPKAVSVSVAGVVIDGNGYGSASVKKVGSTAVRIE